MLSIRSYRLIFLLLTASMLTVIYRLNPLPDDQSIITTYMPQPHSRFCILYDVHVAKKSFRQEGLEPITLAAHATTNFFHMIQNQAHNWDGPISLSLYVDYRSAVNIPFLLRVIECHPTVSDRLHLHIVYERSPFQSDCVNISIEDRKEVPCAQATFSKMKSLSETHPAPFAEYPINLMRNTARRGAPTSLQLVADIEMEFSDNFTKLITPLANQLMIRNSKKAIVIRRFEVGRKTTVPRTVQQLRKLFKVKKSFEYHHSIFARGHRIPGLFSWFNLSENSTTPTTVPTEYAGQMWEPQVILHSDDPVNDENIPTRYRDQQVLIYELCRAGYTFEVATHGFNVNHGIRNRSSPMEAAVVLANGRGRFRAIKSFKDRIDRLYPDTASKCGNFTY